MGQISWYCFRASCNTRGVVNEELNISDIKKRFSNGSYSSDIAFHPPDYFTYPLDNSRVYNYLENNHCLSSYGDNRVEIRYDPKEDRVVFYCLNDKKKIVNATGRSLIKHQIKWRIYGPNNYPFHCPSSVRNSCNKGTLAVIVEDAASACAVSDLCDGIALLGTNLSFDYLHLLKKYDRIIIALDKDATSKAVKIQNSLRYFVDSNVVMLERDLKKLNKEQIKGVLHEHVGASTS